MSTPPRPTAPPPAPASGTTPGFQIIGRPRRPLGDLYHAMLAAGWRRFFAALVGLYVAINAVFALLYLTAGDSITNARHGSFTDAFFFSVQTMATIGYGVMAPRTLWAHVLVSIEALFGLLGISLATGLMFAKFARPTARVLFSRIVVISPHEGVPSLMVRMANERTNQIVEAQARLVLVRDEMTAEGVAMRRFYDLRLLRSQTAVFALTWTAVHPITPDSPLYGQTPESLAAGDANLLVSVAGLDDTFGQTVHARKGYRAHEVVWHARFADVISRLPNGGRQIDYSRFHDVVPLAHDPAG